MTELSRNIGEKIECLLCPHFCKLTAGKTGICGARKNTGHKIELITYGVISGFSLDPVEKKPLYHFFPGQNILSIGSYGCNMRCDFCQNFNISQKVPETLKPDMTPEKLIREAVIAERNIGIGFTYNEPSIWFEYMRDVATVAKSRGLYTVMVSNGYVNSGPLSEIIGFIDAFNIDLKAFNIQTHKKLTGTDLEPVKNSLKQISGAGRHLEITSLIIPGQNDSIKEMEMQADWIAEELGKDTPLHLSRYFPMYRRDDPATSPEMLTRLFDAASEKLDYVYMGNTHLEKGQNTHCPKCGKTVTVRSGYSTTLLNLDNEGRCIDCGTRIYKNLATS